MSQQAISFFVIQFHYLRIFRHLKETLRMLKSVGIIVVAAAGNTGSKFIDSDLYDGSTIMVGSHNSKGCISQFSNGECRVNVCSLGEDLYMKHVTPHIRRGTSFAAPHVTAVVANLISYSHSLPNQKSLQQYLKDTASSLTCECINHHGDEINLKLNPTSLMSMSSCHEIEIELSIEIP